MQLDFQESTLEPFREIWRRMQTNPKLYLTDSWVEIWSSILDGSRRGVIFGDYAATVVYSKASGFCNWGMLQDTLLPSGYGFAFSQGSPYKPFVDNA